MMWGYTAINWWWMTPMMVLFWGVVVALIVFALRGRTGPGRDRIDAVETLRTRLASGDITQDEFETTKRLLQG